MFHKQKLIVFHIAKASAVTKYLFDDLVRDNIGWRKMMYFSFMTHTFKTDDTYVQKVETIAIADFRLQP